MENGVGENDVFEDMNVFDCLQDIAQLPENDDTNIQFQEPTTQGLHTGNFTQLTYFDRGDLDRGDLDNLSEVVVSLDDALATLHKLEITKQGVNSNMVSEALLLPQNMQASRMLSPNEEQYMMQDDIEVPVSEIDVSTPQPVTLTRKSSDVARNEVRGLARTKKTPIIREPFISGFDFSTSATTRDLARVAKRKRQAPLQIEAQSTIQIPYIPGFEFSKSPPNQNVARIVKRKRGVPETLIPGFDFPGPFQIFQLETY